MRCPFCHNTPLVTGTAEERYSEEEIFSFLKKRQGLLDGVAVTGGEPLLQKDIVEFLSKIKKMGYKVKLDTNGSYPERLQELVEKGLADYIAMDIKNCKEKYSLTSGTEIDISVIERSVDIIKESGIPHEFRTTVVRELHTKEDISSVARWLGEGENYFLQSFKDSGDILCPGLSAHDENELISMAVAAGKYVKHCETRGI